MLWPCSFVEGYTGFSFFCPSNLSTGNPAKVNHVCPPASRAQQTVTASRWQTWYEICTHHHKWCIGLDKSGLPRACPCRSIRIKQARKRSRIGAKESHLSSFQSHTLRNTVYYWGTVLPVIKRMDFSSPSRVVGHFYDSAAAPQVSKHGIHFDVRLHL